MTINTFIFFPSLHQTKEQNAIIEDKITHAQLAKEDSTLNKYNIYAVTPFIKTIFADEGEVLKRVSIPEIKVLLDLMFASDVAWDYNGTLSPTISSLYL